MLFLFSFLFFLSNSGDPTVNRNFLQLKLTKIKLLSKIHILLSTHTQKNNIQCRSCYVSTSWYFVLQLLTLIHKFNIS